MAAVAFAAAVALSACGGGDDPTITGGPGDGSVKPSSVAGVDAEHNDADIAFIAEMTPHHQGAVQMAELVATRAESPEVKELAVKIIAAQDPEIEMMNKMATAWGVDLEEAAAEHGGAHGAMMGEDDTAALEPLSGAEFDREFLTRMVVHHEGAVEMAETLLADGLNPQAKQMAADIMESQTAEIEEMNTLLADL
jgi:uncharacterized protein (DUF305 family)